MSTETKHHQKQISKEDLKKIRNKLPYRYVSELIEKIGNPKVNEGLINAVMGGHRPDNYKIIATAIKWGNQIEKDLEDLRKEAGI